MADSKLISDGKPPCIECKWCTFSYFMESLRIASCTHAQNVTEDPVEGGTTLRNSFALVVRTHVCKGKLFESKEQKEPALTPTGRVVDNQPNMQNIPVRTKAGASIRRAFTESK